MAAIKTKTTGKSKHPRTRAKKQIARSSLLWSGIALAALGTAGYIGWRHLRMRKNRFDLIDTLPTSTNGSQTSMNDGFPMSLGSRGVLVKQLQQSLINQYGKSILPRFGADGIWGKETQNALMGKGLPTSITKLDFARITAKSSSKAQSTDPSTLARQLIQAVKARNFSTVDRLLQSMKLVNDYEAVNAHFRTIRLFGVRYTLVTALFKYFTSTSQKEVIRKHLLRMGLKFDERKWSLFGLGALSGHPIITIRPTTIWDGKRTTVEVPSNLLLGKEISSNKGFTHFKTLDNHQLIVHTNAIAYAPYS